MSTEIALLGLVFAVFIVYIMICIKNTIDENDRED